MNGDPGRDGAPAGPGARVVRMPIGMIVEVSLRILRRNWATVLLLALLFAGPGALLTAATGIRFNSLALDILPGIDGAVLDGAPLLTAAEVQRLGEALLAYVAATLVAGLLGSIGAVGISSVVGAEQRGQRGELREALLTCLRRTPSVLVFALLTSLVIVALAVAALVAMGLAVTLFSSGSIQRGGPGVFLALVIGVALVVALAYLTMRWALAFPIMAIEDAGWRAALVRSWRLAGDNVWRIFVVVLFGAMATVFVAALVSQLLAIVIVDLLAVNAGLDATVAESVVIALGTVLLAPLSPALLAVLSLDLRRRHDGSAARAVEGDPGSLP
jgi:hypothetical protein